MHVEFCTSLLEILTEVSVISLNGIALTPPLF